MFTFKHPWWCKILGHHFKDSSDVVWNYCLRCQFENPDRIPFHDGKDWIKKKPKKKLKRHMATKEEILQMTDVELIHELEVATVLKRTRHILYCRGEIMKRMTDESDLEDKHPMLTVIIDEVADAPSEIPEMPTIRPPGTIIPKQHLCPICDKVMTPDVNIKNMFDCKPCGLSFGKYQLEALESFEPLPTKTGEELLKDAMTSGDNWTSGDADPKADLTVTIKQCHPLHRQCIIDSFDPDGKVWSEEERKEMLEAPMVYNEEDFRPLQIRMPEGMVDWFADKICIHCGRGLYTVHEQNVKQCGRCEGRSKSKVREPTQKEIEVGLGSLFGGGLTNPIYCPDCAVPLKVEHEEWCGLEGVYTENQPLFPPYEDGGDDDV